MNLLLLLSALLSAFGGTVGVRTGQAPAAVSRSIVSVAKAATVSEQRAAARPVQAMPGLAALMDTDGRAFALTAAIPAFASRRRE